MAEREGWTVVGEYEDEGFTAYSGNRGPGLEAALARGGSIAGIVAFKASRLQPVEGAPASEGNDAGSLEIADIDDAVPKGVERELVGVRITCRARG